MIIPTLPTGLTGDERQRAGLLNFALVNLYQQVEDFRACVALFDHSADADAALEQKPPGSFSHREHREDFAASMMMSRWKLLAARQGVMAIYHFAHALRTANKEASQCPTIWATVDRLALGAVQKSMQQHFAFADIYALRQATAHATEFLEELDRHSTRKPITTVPVHHEEDSGPLFVSGNLNGRVYQAMYCGREVTCEISSRTADRLAAIKDAFFAALSRQRPPPLP